MVKFCVATDSGCDLSAKFCKERGIYAYRMKYTIDNNEFFDQMEPEDCVKFYKKIREGAIPHTSQMTPFEFIDFWKKIFENFNLPIVHIALGSAISGTYANAIIAKKLFLDSHPQAKIYLVDSTLASIGYGMLCIWAANMRDAGKTPEECVEMLEKRKLSINTYYTTNDLKYLYRSGRVNKAGAIVGTALSINPILNLDKEGHLVVREKVRGRKKAFNRIYDIVKELVIDPEDQLVYICHSDCQAKEIKTFSDTLINKIHFKGSFISYIGPTIGSHSGPGLIAAFFVGQPRFM
ncbi:MAG: DegV family protein [Bacillota bacterium]|jgi:DegV family protein with EDD domain